MPPLLCPNLKVFGHEAWHFALAREGTCFYTKRSFISHNNQKGIFFHWWLLLTLLRTISFFSWMASDRVELVAGQFGHVGLDHLCLRDGGIPSDQWSATAEALGTLSALGCCCWTAVWGSGSLCPVGVVDDLVVGWGFLGLPIDRVVWSLSELTIDTAARYFRPKYSQISLSWEWLTIDESRRDNYLVIDTDASLGSIRWMRCLLASRNSLSWDDWVSPMVWLEFFQSSVAMFRSMK